MSKLLLVGLDGATFNIIRPLVDRGQLPTLAYLLRHGASGTLHSTVPPITPTAWTTVFTGKDPGKHGIFDFSELAADYTRRPVRATGHREKPLWQLLGDAGLRSIISDVPFTYPPAPLNGVMLTGYGTPRSPDTVFTYPDDLARRVPPELRDQVRVALPRHAFDRSAAFVAEWQAIMDGRRRWLEHWLSAEPWDFFFHVFSITDNLAHVFWTYLEPRHPNFAAAEAPAFRDALLGAYRQCDALLGDMLAWAGPDTNVLIISDHGFGSIYPRQYLFNRLAAGGFVRFRTPSRAAAAGDRLLRLAVGAYNRLPWLREWVKGLRPQRKKALGSALRQGGLLPEAAALDVTRSTVLPTSFGLQMWLNRRDRFDHGLLAPAEAAALLDRLEQHLLADRVGATPVIARTYRGADLYDGPAAVHGPDLVVEYSDFFRFSAEPAPHAQRHPQLEGGHTPDGILIAHGPAIQPQAAVDMRLHDIAPTVLHLLDRPVPVDMDGHVAEALLTPALRAARPVRRDAAPAVLDGDGDDGAFSAEQAADLHHQLRQLGYVD